MTGDEVWLAVKFQTNLEIAGSPRNSFRASVGNAQFTYCWLLAWRILSITLLACDMRAIIWQCEHSLALPFFGTGIKTDLFQSCDHCWVFQICWQIECNTFTASCFRIWNHSAGTPLPPLTLFIMMLLKAHLTLHSKMVIAPSSCLQWGKRDTPRQDLLLVREQSLRQWSVRAI